MLSNSYFIIYRAESVISKFYIQEKSSIVLDGMHHPEGITGLYRQVGISGSTYYHRQKAPLEKGACIITL